MGELCSVNFFSLNILRSDYTSHKIAIPLLIRTKIKVVFKECYGSNKSKSSDKKRRVTYSVCVKYVTPEICRLGTIM